MGNYRIIYQITDQKLQIIVVRAGHRKNIYLKIVTIFCSVIHGLYDLFRYEDEKANWKSETPREKLYALEMIRETGNKLLHHNNKASEGIE